MRRVSYPVCCAISSPDDTSSSHAPVLLSLALLLTTLTDSLLTLFYFAVAPPTPTPAIARTATSIVARALWRGLGGDYKPMGTQLHAEVRIRNPSAKMSAASNEELVKWLSANPRGVGQLPVWTLVCQQLANALGGGAGGGSGAGDGDDDAGGGGDGGDGGASATEPPPPAKKLRLNNASAHTWGRFGHVIVDLKLLFMERDKPLYVTSRRTHDSHASHLTHAPPTPTRPLLLWRVAHASLMLRRSRSTGTVLRRTARRLRRARTSGRCSRHDSMMSLSHRRIISAVRTLLLSRL